VPTQGRAGRSGRSTATTPNATRPAASHTAQRRDNRGLIDLMRCPYLFRVPGLERPTTDDRIPDAGASTVTRHFV